MNNILISQIKNKKIVKTRLGSKSDKNTIDLAGLLNLSEKEKPIFLKMDIERAEYEVLTEQNISLLAERNVICLLIEFYSITKNKKKFERIVSGLENAGFFIGHLHGNNYTPFKEDIGIYNCSEILFLKDWFQLRKKVGVTKLPIIGLDRANNTKKGEVSYSIGISK